MSSSRTLSRKFRTFFTCIKPRFDPSIIVLYIAVSVEQYCDITHVNALPENEGILEPLPTFYLGKINSLGEFVALDEHHEDEPSLPDRLPAGIAITLAGEEAA